MRLALHQPDIPQNVGAAIRLSACLGLRLDVIEPCGFPLTDKALKRAALDYGALARLERWAGLSSYVRALAEGGQRLVLVETDGACALHDFRFSPADALVFGSESAGADPALRAAAHASVRIPMVQGARSLNVVVSAALAAGEALRQTNGFKLLEHADDRP